ncbi:MAG: VWA domain-containing protein [Deltaproteobacteria bacterium]|nr:VWA domain-containing protein [Deltaproteobacteria bacterium]
MTIDFRSKVDCRLLPTHPPPPFSLTRSGGAERERSWEKFAAPSFSLSGSLTLFAAVLSRGKPRRFYPYVGASILLHIGLLKLFTRLTKKPEEPQVIEVEFVSPEPQTPLPKEPPPFLPPGNEGTSPKPTRNKGPELVVDSQKKAPQHPSRSNRGTPKITAPKANFGGPLSSNAPLGEEGDAPQAAEEGEPNGSDKGDSDGESMTPLEQLPASLYQGRVIEAEEPDNRRRLTQFGQQLLDHLTLREKKDHYQIALLIDRSGSMLPYAKKIRDLIDQIMEHGQSQVIEGGHVTFALWIYMGAGFPLKHLKPDSEISELSDSAELTAMKTAIEQAIEIIETKPAAGPEYTWDTSIALMNTESFSTLNEVGKVIIAITDDESACFFIKGLEQYCPQGTGDNSVVKVRDAATRKGIRYEVIRRSNF